MKQDIWHLPWTSENVPHALIDIIRGCNVTCRSCYNALPPSVKTLEEITNELNTLMRMRKLHSVSIIGGEVLMHPRLFDVVRMIRSRGLRVELFSNGVLLTSILANELKAAGVDMIFLHIEPGQKRPDLPSNASLSDLRKLIEEKTALVASCGMDVGLTITAYEDSLDEMMDMIRFTIESKHSHFLLVTLSRDVKVIESIHGDLLGGLTAIINRAAAEKRQDKLTNEWMKEFLGERLKLKPFAYLGSNLNKFDLRWLSYMVGTIRNPRRATFVTSFKPSLVEKMFMQIYRLATGRYPFNFKQNTKPFRMQLLLNALTGGNFLDNMIFLGRSFSKGTTVKYKRLVFQNLADVDSDGRVVHCLNCPDAVLKGGRLVPVCLTDRVN